MPFVKCLPKSIDEGDAEGRNGRVETYVCGALIEMGVWKVIMKWLMSSIL